MFNQVLAQENPDVALLQEACRAPTQVAGFARDCAKKGKGYTVYFQSPKTGRSGGVLTLVNKALPQRPALRLLTTPAFLYQSLH